MKTGKRRAGEKKKRKQATDFKEAVWQSFRRQHSEKMKRSAWGNWDPRKVQQPFRPNPNGVGDLTSTSRHLLIDVESTQIMKLILQ